MVMQVKIKSMYGKETVRLPVATPITSLRTDHLRRYGVKGLGHLYAVLLDGAVLYPSATLEQLGVPEDAELTVVLMQATAI